MCAALALGAAIGGLSNAVAQSWPSRQVTLVVPYAAGAASDIVARTIAPRLAELLGQAVIIENVPGAGGLTGSVRVARAAPDFHQVVLGNSGTHAQNQSLFKHPPYNPATDFMPVALIGTGAMVLLFAMSCPQTISQNSSLTPRRTRRRCNMVPLARVRLSISPACF
jgi:tripartite-type tricarboxylate transporter receptor subunit TctC